MAGRAILLQAICPLFGRILSSHFCKTEEAHSTESQETWTPVLVLQITFCVTLVKSFSLSVPHLCPFYRQGNLPPIFVNVLNEIAVLVLRITVILRAQKMQTGLWGIMDLVLRKSGTVSIQTGQTYCLAFHSLPALNILSHDPRGQSSLYAASQQRPSS